MGDVITVEIFVARYRLKDEEFDSKLRKYESIIYDNSSIEDLQKAITQRKKLVTRYFEKYSGIT